MLVALCSAKGSPGVTTAALALTFAWPGRCVLAECDPAGGSVQAGYLAGALPADRGIGELAVAELRGVDLRRAWWGQVIDLQPPRRRRLLLPGITDPVQSGALAPVWDRLAAFFAQLDRADSPATADGSGIDVIADCGRLTTSNPPWPLLCCADAVLLVLPATLPGLSAATPLVRALRTHLAEVDPRLARLGLLVTGSGDQPVRTVGESLRTSVVSQLPYDARTARALSRGGPVRGGAPLMTGAGLAAREITRRIGRNRPAAAATGGELQ